MTAFSDPRLPARFWAKVHIAETGCWEWRANKVRGYGRFSHGGRMWLAHRVAHAELIGPIPDGLDVLHSCDNPPCVNPAHLRAGTDQDNMRDQLSRGRHGNIKKTHCPQGHEYTKENTHVRRNGKRECRTCMSDRCRRWRRRNIGTVESDARGAALADDARELIRVTGHGIEHIAERLGVTKAHLYQELLRHPEADETAAEPDPALDTELAA